MGDARAESPMMNPRLVVDAAGFGRLVFADPGRSHNVLTPEVMEGLDARIAEAERAAGDGALRVLTVASDKPTSFVAGADVGAIEEIARSRDRERAMEASRRGQAIFGRLAALPVPTVAAVRGLCLGGGAELALACDWRVGADDAATRIGLPEVQLGLLPAWGGATRLPRLVGLRAALGMILTGKPVGAAKARRMGLLDEALPTHGFEAHAADFARALANGSAPARKRPAAVGRLVDGTWPGRRLVLWTARRRVAKRTRGRYPAPLEVLKVLRKGARSPAASLELEVRAIGDLVASPVCGNLLFLFRLREAARKGPWTTSGRRARVDRMGVVGAGAMGGGIAQLAAFHDVPVRMRDVRREAVSGGLAHARALFDGAVKRRRLRPRDAERKMRLISGTTDDSGMRRASLVVEAVVERLDVKRAVLEELERSVGPQAVLASNTSTLSIDEMAAGLERPERFLGMHFFNPVHRMPLVEVVRGERTSDDAVETVAAFAVRMGKAPVVVRDAPGFLVNRVLGPCLNEAGRLLDERCDARAVDRIWRDFGMPMGPFRLIDEIGIDVVGHAGAVLAARLGARLEPAASLVALGRSGRLGRKGGRGFYVHGEDGEARFDPSVYPAMRLPAARVAPDAEEVRDRLALTMVDEAARVLEEGVAASAADVDLAMAMGTGFPPFRGGLLRYADDRGPGVVLERLERLRDRGGDGRHAPSALLEEIARDGTTFHAAFPGGGSGRGE